MKKGSLNADEKATLLLLFALIFGAWFRVMPAWTAGFPINDGGMFFTMMEDLQANDFKPPLYTSYNNLNIPFAYPPFALYVGTVISRVFNLSGIDVLRWVPGVVNSFSVLAFYYLAKEILKDKVKGAVATLVFSFTPHLTNWLSAGGGLTRSFGFLFTILTVQYAHKLFRTGNIKWIWPVIVCGSLATLSHPEATLYAVVLSMLTWLMNKVPFSKRNIFHVGFAIFGVSVIAGSWYGWIIYNHGIGSILSAIQTGSHSPWAILKILNLRINTEETFLGLFSVLGILGIIFLLIKKDYLIPGMLLIVYFAQPRSAHIFSNIPLAMASGFFIVEGLLPSFSHLTDSHSLNRAFILFLLLIAPYTFANSLSYALSLSQNHVSEEERIAMQWIRENTPLDSHFLVLTDETEAWCDSSAEWFPALTGRSSITTLQGREWLLGNSLNKFASNRIALQVCIKEDVGCLEKELAFFDQYPDFIYISAKSPTRNCQPHNVYQTKNTITLFLEENSDYKRVYDSVDVIVFERKK